MSDNGGTGPLLGAVAEGLATFMFVALGVGAVGAALTASGGVNAAGVILIALGHGFGILLGVAVLGRVSGAHMNPAVTLGLLLTGKVDALRAALYVGAQIVGAVAAAVLVRWCFQVQGTGVHALAVGVPVSVGFALEFVLTFFVVFTYFATMVDGRANAAWAPLAMGGVYLAGQLVAVPVTGASMNPARTVGTAAVWSAWGNQWLYWAAPLAGGAVAALLYTRLFGERA